MIIIGIFIKIFDDKSDNNGDFHFHMIKKYKVNRTLIYKCDRFGIPMKEGREKPRTNLLFGEKVFEKNYLEKVRQVGFEFQKSICYQWISDIFDQKKPKLQQAKSIAFFFGILLNDLPTREVYRRLWTIIYWIESRLTEINNICTSNEIKIQISKRVKKISPPLLYEKANPTNEQENEFGSWFHSDEEEFLNEFLL